MAPVRALVPLDYDEVRTSLPPRAAGAVSPAGTRRRNGFRWFALGIAFGAAAAVVLTGGAGDTLRSARAWSGRALRSLEHRPVPVAPAPSHTMQATIASSEVPVETSRPCPANPGPDDPCSELLAPFGSDGTQAGPVAADVPTVPVEDLPRVKPAPVAPRGRLTPMGAVPATTTAQERPAPPRDVSPDGDDPASPERTAPTRATPDPAPGPERPGSDNAPT